MTSHNGAQNGNTAPFRIAIVGGAIGGLSAALFLHHFCGTQSIAIDVYEQASEYREIGAGVGLGLNAAKLMHIIPGVGESMNAIAGRSDDSWFTFVRYDNGKKITHVDGPGKGETVRPCSMARSEYLDILLGVIRERNVAKLHTKKKFVSVKVSLYKISQTSAIELTSQKSPGSRLPRR